VENFAKFNWPVQKILQLTAAQNYPNLMAHHDLMFVINCRVDKYHDFLNTNRKHRFFYLNQIFLFKSIF